MPQSSRHHLLMYSKRNCPLCDKARAVIRTLQRRHVLSLEEIDILDDPALFERYKYEIPVIVVDGDTTVKAPITEEALRRAIESGKAES